MSILVADEHCWPLEIAQRTKTLAPYSIIRINRSCDLIAQSSLLSAILTYSCKVHRVRYHNQGIEMNISHTDSKSRLLLPLYPSQRRTSHWFDHCHADRHSQLVLAS